MGGSSLAPEVLRQVLGVAPGYPRFRMLDSVDPDAVRDAFEQAATSMFILASKSGSTIEPNVMAAEARARVIASGEPDWASRFVAITDEGTALHQRAVAEGFREIFVNPSDIGGRYSALSLFGMVPAAVMGADLDSILAQAREMESACRSTDVRTNPGLALGAFMAAGAEAGRDKLSLMLAPPLDTLGLWIEQLVAESTGKQGKGVVPIALGEFPGMPMGPDRVVVALYPPGGTRARLLDPLRNDGVPLFEIEVPDQTAIGAEFLRWEIATATAGVLMDINPFDEPNVKQAKDATRALLDEFEKTGRLPVHEPHADVDGVTLTLSAAAEQALGGAGVDRFLSVLRTRRLLRAARLPSARPRSIRCRSARAARNHHGYAPVRDDARVWAEIPALHRPAAQGWRQQRRLPDRHRGARSGPADSRPAVLVWRAGDGAGAR